MHMQLLLLAKAVVVALLGQEVVFPGQETGQSGLLAMYLAICYSIVGTAVQYYTAETLITGMAYVSLTNKDVFVAGILVCKHCVSCVACHIGHSTEPMRQSSAVGLQILLR